jgi:hypothetical protein
MTIIPATEKRDRLARPDGVDGSACFLLPGMRTFAQTSAASSLAVIWAQAVDRRFTPFNCSTDDRLPFPDCLFLDITRFRDREANRGSNPVRVAISSKRRHPPPLANRRCVQDESIVVEHDEVNVFASHHFNRAASRRITENRRTLFRELDEENLTDVRASSKTFLIIVNAGKSGAPTPSIGVL